MVKTKIALATASLVSSVLLTSSQPVSAAQISWSECAENVTSNVQCGTLPVPLDYADSEGPSINVSMVRMVHIKEPFLGSIFFNPGGPGYGARNLIDSSGAGFLNMTGGQFDLIGHDPRGTGNTIPFSCFETEVERISIENLYQDTSKGSEQASNIAWSTAKLYRDICATTMNNTGNLIGTAYTARDIMAIVDALGEDGFVRFWGLSYGSALGTTLAKMFPDRVGRVIVDGVLNMHQYYAAEDWGQVTATDDALSAFFADCAEAGQEKCALARADKTAADLEADFYALIEEVSVNPISLGLTYQDWISAPLLKNLVLNGLRTPVALFPYFGEALNAVNTRNVTAWRTYAYVVLGAVDAAGVFPELGVEAALGIRGSDTNPAMHTDDLDSLNSLRGIFYNASVATGDTFFDTQTMRLKRWKMPAKEITPFEGDMNFQTSHPLLFIGNPLDHLTPLSNAFNTSAYFEGSVVLQHNGRGHCSTGQPSMCTARVVQSYLINGTLPEPGMQCEPDIFPFANVRAMSEKRNTMPAKDWELLEAMSEVKLF